jgi:hypothetical protein
MRDEARFRVRLCRKYNKNKELSSVKVNLDNQE